MTQKTIKEEKRTAVQKRMVESARVVSFVVPQNIATGTSVTARAMCSERKVTYPVSFNRVEFDAILRIYGMMVAAGEWRDYAIDHLEDRAIFSIFRSSRETPLYRIEKQPKRASRQGVYAVIAAPGLVLKYGHNLTATLRVLERKMLKII